jgi:hypothetical protein
MREPHKKEADPPHDSAECTGASGQGNSMMEENQAAMPGLN